MVIFVKNNNTTVMPQDMGVLATDKKQYIYIYSNKSESGKRLLAYAQSIDGPVRTINIDNEKISDTVWTEILELLNMSAKDLFGDSHNLSKDINGDEQMDTHDWLKVIQNNPEVLATPIIIKGEHAKLVANQHDLSSFFEADGSNFDKSPEAIKKANHKDTTKNEQF
ncbi:arsenate reductase family protein [Croceivirga sp. JEA036]|uniref:arsenate reductase family protein n=1 Tax=Croceivirga sp. JEA036 TaxID=2721162 RepID=UPI0016A2710A|nr:hypothetical protein [Croceivirga sp. JEA036]NJB36636.1 hypothetical protein [Croceivirga sp. JEA036]